MSSCETFHSNTKVSQFNFRNKKPVAGSEESDIRNGNFYKKKVNENVFTSLKEQNVSMASFEQQDSGGNDSQKARHRTRHPIRQKKSRSYLLT
jgi:hypothetical protein